MRCRYPVNSHQYYSSPWQNTGSAENPVLSSIEKRIFLIILSWKLYWVGNKIKDLGGRLRIKGWMMHCPRCLPQWNVKLQLINCYDWGHNYIRLLLLSTSSTPSNEHLLIEHLLLCEVHASLVYCFMSLSPYNLCLYSMLTIIVIPIV